MTQQDVTKCALVDWYESERRGASYRSRKAAAAVWGSIAITVLQLLGTVFIVGFEYDELFGGLPGALLLCWTLVVAGIAVTVWCRTKVGASSIKGLIAVDAIRIPDIVEVIEALGLKMDLRTADIGYWLSIHPGSASVVETGSGIRLQLSVNVVADARRDRAAVRGLLAHELAHILHEDTNVWWIVKRVAVPLRAVLMSMIGIAFAVAALTSMFFHGWPWNWDLRVFTYPNVVPYLLTLLLSYAVKLYQRAEVLADCAAVLATGSDDVRASLARYLPEDDEQDVKYEKERGEHSDIHDDLHPTKASRLARILEFEAMRNAA